VAFAAGVLVVKEGMIAFNDLGAITWNKFGLSPDSKRKGFVPWGYCPSIVMFRRE